MSLFFEKQSMVGDQSIQNLVLVKGLKRAVRVAREEKLVVVSHPYWRTVTRNWSYLNLTSIS